MTKPKARSVRGPAGHSSFGLLSSFGFRHSGLLVPALLLGLLCSPSQLCAQFDDEPAPMPAAADAKDAPGKAPPAPPKPVDPAVITILESNPTSPSDLVRSIDALLNLGAAEDAAKLFKKLAATPLTEQQRAALGRQFDAGIWFRFSQVKEFGPEGTKFVGSIMAALRKAQEDPNRTAQLVQALANPDASARDLAIADLVHVGRPAIGPLVAVLANPQHKAAQPGARAALVALGSQALEPLLAVLDDAGPELQAQIVAVLAQSNDPRAAEALLVESVAPGASPTVRQLAQQAVRRSFDEQPSQVQVAAQLIRQIDEYMKAERRLPVDQVNLSEMWRYDPKTGQLSSIRVPAEAAAAIHAAWLARRLRAVAPDSATAEQWRLLTNLHAAKMLGGLGQPLKNGPGQPALARAVSRGSALIEPVLRQALAKNHVPAALAALEVLSETGDPSLLKPATSPAPHVLVKAANHPDRRIRLAAIETLVRLKPRHPLAGSSAVSQALLDFANFSGTRRAVVADPRGDRGHELAALLDQCGFTTSVASTGRQAFLDAVASTEVELVLIAMTVEHPDADELLRQLRRDPRTARLPVALIAKPDHLYRAEGIALGDPLTMAFVRPRDLPTMQERVASLEKLGGYNHVPHAERQQQAAKALTLLAELSDAGAPSIFSLQGMDAAAEAGLYLPELAPAAIQVLARSRTSRSQKALVDLASAATQPLDVRQAAAAAFAESVKRHRIQLTIADIQQQARRYEESGSLDQPSQDVLWSLLETMQKTKATPKKKMTNDEARMTKE